RTDLTNGWGRRIRTPANGSRARRPTARRSPSACGASSLYEPRRMGVNARAIWYHRLMNTRRRKDSDHEERAAQPQTPGEIRDATLPCPQCRGEMHPMFLYEDRE